MTIHIDARTDIQRAARWMSGVQTRAVLQAGRRSMRRTARQVLTEARRRVSREMGVQQKRVSRAFRVITAQNDPFYAAVEARGRPLPLKAFRPKQGSRGVTVPGKAGGRRIYRSHFIVDSLGGHVFVRTGVRRRMRHGRYAGRVREAIRKVYGPSVPETFIRAHISRAMRTVAAQRWRVNFAQDLKFYLSKVQA